MESRLTDGHNDTTVLEVRLRSIETQLEQLENHTAYTLMAAEEETEVLQVQLRLAEATTDQLKTENEAQSALLSHITSRLDAAESHGSVLQSRLNRTENLRETRAYELEVRLRSTETQLEQLENHTAALEVRLNVGEKHLDDLKTEHTDQSAQLSLMESRLTDGHNDTTELEVRLRSTETQLEHLRTEHTALSFRLNETEVRLQKLTETNSDELNVAFSAGLTDSGSVGPFDEETTLIFSKTITNVGQAYDQTAGVFTAPVRGLYFFSFTVADYLKGYMGLYLYRNDQPILFNLDLNDHGGYASMSNGVVLQLEEGDGVRLSLPASYRLYDDSRNFTIFSGFLLFPL